ncbi:MAG: flippase activity-associated protein Agl23 [Anaerolineae bacterium]
MAEHAAEPRLEGFLKRPITSWLRLDGYALVAALLVAVALVTRLWDLGTRAYNHDEAIHAWESWKLITGQGYIHNPVYHGPFLYHITALGYFLFGHNDYTGRLAAALFGAATVALVLCFRRWLGSKGTLVAAGLAIISPSLLYYGRFIRHDAFSVVFTLVMAIGILNYLERRENKYLYLTVLGQALYFANMETAFIQTFTFWTFLAALLLSQWLSDTKRSLRSWPAFDLLMVMGTLLLPLASPLGIKAMGLLLGDPERWNPIAYQQSASIVRSGVVWAVFFVASVAVGLFWDRRRWPVAAAIFYSIFVVLFTTFFTNGYGLATGQVGQLGYWLSQHGERRGGQPWHYYLVLLPLYDYLPLLFATLGGVFYIFRRRPAAAAQAVSVPEPAQMADVVPVLVGQGKSSHAADVQGQGPDSRKAVADGPRIRVVAAEATGAPFVPLLMYWFLANLVVFSWGGEKMPWLAVHMSLPLVLLAGWFGGQLLDVDWRAAWARGAGWVALLVPLLLVAVVGTLSNKPFQGTSSAQLGQTMGWIGGFILMLILGLPLVYRVSDLGWRASVRVVLLVVFVFLAAFTVRHSVMAVYLQGDSAEEMLTYAQASYDVPMVMRELESMSRRLAGGEKDLRLAYDNDSSWPFVWYLRDWPNARFYGAKPDAPFDEAVVIVGPQNEEQVKPFLGTRYYRRQYRLVWWPDETYKTLTPAKILRDLSDSQARKRLWEIIMFRKYGPSLAGWPLVHNFALYVRKDVAAQLWDYGPEAAMARSPEEDPYTKQYRQLTAKRSISSAEAGSFDPRGIALDGDGRLIVADAANSQVLVLAADGRLEARWGRQGNEALQFQEPWGVAVGPTGAIYVADTWNHRIQKLDAQGRFLGTWGTFGQTQGLAQGPGVFYGPRGIAVDADGNVWVTDTGNKRVCKFDPDGRLLGEYGGSGVGDGQFQEPVGIALDAQGNVYVADTWNQRIQVFDAGFRYLRQWPIDGWWGQSASNKPYLAVDALSNVYVTDPEAQRIVKFSPEGKVLAVWGKLGSDLSSFKLPIGIVVDREGNVLVADGGNGRVLEFDPVP